MFLTRLRTASKILGMRRACLHGGLQSHQRRSGRSHSGCWYKGSLNGRKCDGPGLILATGAAAFNMATFPATCASQRTFVPGVVPSLPPSQLKESLAFPLKCLFWWIIPNSISLPNHNCAFCKRKGFGCKENPRAAELHANNIRSRALEYTILMWQLAVIWPHCWQGAPSMTSRIRGASC
ncbi:hypothetical protein BC834DRAFT_514730 [Gloeopeniophorella convolvens]|nr:hypothetical protein BC834DRAFT_514730 [Gloeopeniophorella convolvens]